MARRHPHSARRTATTALALACVLGACGGAAPPPDLHAAFRAIQVHEATIVHRAPEAAACAGTPPCPAADEVCAAAEGICAIAEEVDDADAHARCAMAEERCPLETRR